MDQLNRADSFNSECAGTGRSADLWTQWRARHLRQKVQMSGLSGSDANADVTATAPPIPPQTWPRIFPAL